MSNADTPYFVVVVLSAVIFLVAVPQESQCQDSLSVAKSAVSLLTPFVNSYRSSLCNNIEAENVNIRLWMHNRDHKRNGCGFHFVVAGYAGGTRTGHLPSVAVHNCGHDKYEMRMTSQSVMYHKEILLGKEQAKTIEVHSDGWANTFVNVMCFGLSERTIAGGPREFCINNQLLKECKSLSEKWNDVNIDSEDILMTRTRRGIHKIIFSDIETLVTGSERLKRNCFDKDALHMVCRRIDLVSGGDSRDSWDCSASKVGGGHHRDGNSSNTDHSWENNSWENERKDPYGCERSTKN